MNPISDIGVNILKITIWNRLTRVKDAGTNETLYFNKEHNHFEENWVESEKPEPCKEEFVLQKSWKNFDWVREFGYLVRSENQSILIREPKYTPFDSRKAEDLQSPIQPLKTNME